MDVQRDALVASSRGTDILPLLQARVRPGPVRTGVEKENVFVSPGFETRTLLLVAGRYIDYLVPEYTGGTD